MANNFERETFRPSGSPLADSVMQAVQEDLAARAEEVNRRAEEVNRRAEENKERIRGIKAGLQNTFTNLDIMEVLQDIRDNIWRIGEILDPTFERIDPSSGKLAAELEFVYDDIAVYENEDQFSVRDSSIFTRHHRPAKKKETLRIGIIKEEPRPTVGGTSSDYTIEVISRSDYIDAPDSLVVKIPWSRSNEKFFLVRPSKPDTHAFWLISFESATSRLNEVIRDESKKRVLAGKLPGQLAIDGAERIRNLAGKFTKTTVERSFDINAGVGL